MLDFEQTGFCNKEDLIMYLGFFYESCGLGKLNEGNFEAILSKRIGNKDSQKITIKQLELLMKILMEDQIQTFNKAINKQ